MSSLPEVDMRSEQPDPSKKKKWLIWTVAGLLVVGVVLGCTLGFTLNRGGGSQDVAGAQTFESGTVASKKTSYSTKQDVEFSFVNPSPHKDDWIGIAKSGSEVNGELTDAEIVAWAFACGDQDCEEAVDTGKISLSAGSVPPGTYQAFLILPGGEPFKVKASSRPFEVYPHAKPTLKPTQKPNLRPKEDPEPEPEVKPEVKPEPEPETVEEPKTPTPEAEPETAPEVEPETAPETAPETEPETPADVVEETIPEGSFITMKKESYARDESIHISFHNLDASRGDWIAISESGAHKKDRLPGDSTIYQWLYACGDVKCSKKVEKGEVKIEKDSLKAGLTYQAYLLKTDRGAPYKIKAMSSKFKVTNDKFTSSASSDK